MIEQFININNGWVDKENIFKDYYNEYFLSKIIIQGQTGTKFTLHFSSNSRDIVIGISEIYTLDLNKTTKLYGITSDNENLVVTIKYEKKEE